MRKSTSTFAVLVLTLMVASPAAAQGDTEEAIGDFTYTPRQDPMTDEDRSHIVTFDEDENAGLAWKCAIDGLNVWYAGSYLGGDSDNEVRVRYRVGENEPSDRHYWRLASSHELAYMPMDRVPTLTAAAKANGERIVLRVVDPLDGEIRTHVFPITGISAALQRLPCYQ